MLKNTMPLVYRYYSEHKKPFAIFPSQTDHRKEVVEKTELLQVNQSWRSNLIRLVKLLECHRVTLLESAIQLCVAVQHF